MKNPHRSESKNYYTYEVKLYDGYLSISGTVTTKEVNAIQKTLKETGKEKYLSDKHPLYVRVRKDDVK